MRSIVRRHGRGRPPHPDVLTPAEWRVLEQIRATRSNPEIAERLHISRNTVKTHTSSILAKLGARDRAELEGWEGRPVSLHRSLLPAVVGWSGSRVEVAAMAAVATILVVGLVIALRSGVLTDEPASPATVATVQATETVTTPTSAAAAASTVPAVVDCPVLEDVCRLALEFLPAVQSADGPAIAARAMPQRFDCSQAIPVWEDRLTAAELGLCPNAGSQVSVDAYEFHTGKGPGYSTSRREFAGRVSESLSGYGAQATLQPPFRIVAVGCGAEGEGLAADCSRGAAAVYAVNGPISGFGIGPLMIVLVFTRQTESGSWGVQKYWQPYQGGFPLPIIDGTRTQIFDGGGVQHLELHPYDGP